MSSGAPDIAGTVFEGAGSELARSYAQALLGAAENAGRPEAILDELDELIADVWADRPEFARLMASPTLSAADRDRILVEAFEGRADVLIVRFLRVLSRHGRLGLLVPVAHTARVNWERKQGRRRVEVRSAVPLDEGQRASLEGSLAALTEAVPIVRYEVDPELIGGLVVQFGDEVYDGSIRSHLRAIRRTLVGEKMMELRRHGEAFTTTA